MKLYHDHIHVDSYHSHLVEVTVAKVKASWHLSVRHLDREPVTSAVIVNGRGVSLTLHDARRSQ